MFEIGKTYTFNTMAPAVLGVTVKNATLKAIMDYQSACGFTNVDVIQRQVYPLLPPGTPNNTKKYIYYVFTATNGSTLVLANAWVEMPTVEIVNDITITASIPNASLNDVERIRQGLSLMGFRGFNIEVL